MRGSPLVRTLLMALVLGLAAIGIRALTKPAPAATKTIAPPAETAEADQLVVPFFLTLSAPASEVILESGDEQVHLTDPSQVLSGKLPLAPGHPTIFITVRWVDPGTSPRFAKLRLEPKGIESLERTFDAEGELADVWEPHLH